jgi:hypothetical protein
MRRKFYILGFGLSLLFLALWIICDLCGLPTLEGLDHILMEYEAPELKSQSMDQFIQALLFSYHLIQEVSIKKLDGELDDMELKEHLLVFIGTFLTRDLHLLVNERFESVHIELSNLSHEVLINTFVPLSNFSLILIHFQL